MCIRAYHLLVAEKEGGEGIVRKILLRVQGPGSSFVITSSRGAVLGVSSLLIFSLRVKLFGQVLKPHQLFLGPRCFQQCSDVVWMLFLSGCLLSHPYTHRNSHWSWIANTSSPSFPSRVSKKIKLKEQSIAIDLLWVLDPQRAFCRFLFEGLMKVTFFPFTTEKPMIMAVLPSQIEPFLAYSAGMRMAWGTG